MNIETVFCPHCGKQLDYPSSLRGSLVQCKHCSSYFKWEPQGGDSPAARMEQPTQNSASTSWGGGNQQQASSPSSFPSHSGNFGKGAVVIAAAIVVVGIAYCVTNYMGSRYRIDTIDKTTYRIDRHTGAMSIIRPNGVIKEAKEPRKIKSRKLIETELQNLEGWAGLKYEGSSFGGSIYNGNKDVVLTEVAICLTYTNDERRVSRVYKDNVSIGALKTGSVFFDVVNPGRDLSYSGYNISSARGYATSEEENDDE